MAALCENQIMKIIIILIALFSSVSYATEDLCYQQGADAPHNFNQVMEPSAYSVKLTDNGSKDPAEVMVSVPVEYLNIPIMGITVKIGGYNGFATDIATTTKSGKVLGGFYVAKADLPKVTVLANYQSTMPCGGIQITKVFVSYNVPISHNK